jgi:hypothetical protein
MKIDSILTAGLRSEFLDAYKPGNYTLTRQGRIPRHKPCGRSRNAKRAWRKLLMISPRGRPMRFLKGMRFFEYTPTLQKVKWE